MYKKERGHNPSLIYENRKRNSEEKTVREKVPVNFKSDGQSMRSANKHGFEKWG